MSGNFEFVLGGERLVVKGDQLTFGKARELKAAIKQVSEDFDGVLEKFKEDLKKVDEEFASRLEKDEDETLEDWQERIEPVIKEKQAACDAVTPDDLESHVQSLAFKCLQAVGRLFGQEHKITTANFDAADAAKTKMLLAKLLINNECPLGTLFLPPKSLN